MKTMNAYRYITVILFSLLIIFVGAGVAVIHCYCVSCRISHECCETTNHEYQAQKEHQCTASSHADCSNQEEGCVSTVYKIDLSKGTNETPVIEPVALLLCKEMAQFLLPLTTDVPQISSYTYPPLPPGSRQYLALYSVFII